MARKQQRTSAAETCRNEVVLVGRVSAAPTERELPSGDVLLTWRLVVDRPLEAPARRAPAEGGVERRTPTVDALECVARPAGVRRTVSTWVEGDVVHVEGALRRRFWRGPAGLASRYEVEVGSARRLRRAT